MSKLMVLVGPTAVGKGTIVRRLVERFPDVWVSISATTRAPREGEADGVDYFFVTQDEFARMIEDDALLEWATVHGNHRYGTPRGPVDQRIAEGTPVILEIDLQGARQVRQTMPEATFVFVKPPSWHELVRRLEGRGTEDPEERTRRLETARQELDAAEEFDYIVINDSLDAAVSHVNALLRDDG